MIYRIENASVLITALLLCLILCACALTQKKDEYADDFKTSGFLGDNIFQCIITHKPDKTLYGLVEQRESAYIYAKGILAENVTSKLFAYIIEHNPELKPLIENEMYKKQKDQILRDLNLYLKNGFIFHEYYLRDNTAVLVYRIKKSGLKGSIETLAGNVHLSSADPKNNDSK